MRNSTADRKDYVPSHELRAFHKMLETAKRPPVFAIHLEGSEREKQYVVTKETDALKELGIETEYVDELEPEVTYGGTVYFVDTVAPGTLALTIDCGFAKGALLPKVLQDFLEKTNLDIEDPESIMDLPMYQSLFDRCRQDFDSTVVSTVLCHYSKHNDNTWHDDDLDWMEDRKAESEAEPKAEPVEAEPVKQEPIYRKPVEQKIPVKEIPVENPAAKPEPHVEPKHAEPVEEDVPAETPAQPTRRVVKKNDETDVPVPETVEEDKDGTEKGVLTEEEKAKNAKLLSELKAEYQKVIDMIDDGYDTIFRPVQKKLKECVDTNTFNTQFCPLYLEFSSDVSTDLYAELYDLDEQTRAFREQVVHHIEHFGCPMCGTEWDEDLTFAPAGINTIHCPKCGAERPFEVE
jgi:hypothetical protein